MLTWFSTIALSDIKQPINVLCDIKLPFRELNENFVANLSFLYTLLYMYKMELICLEKVTKVKEKDYY